MNNKIIFVTLGVAIGLFSGLASAQNIGCDCPASNVLLKPSVSVPPCAIAWAAPEDYQQTYYGAPRLTYVDNTPGYTCTYLMGNNKSVTLQAGLGTQYTAAGDGGWSTSSGSHSCVATKEYPSDCQVQPVAKH